MDIDQELFNLYKDKALLISSRIYLFISTLLIAAAGIVVPTVLPLFFSQKSDNSNNFNISINYLLITILVVSAFIYFYNDAKYREHKKNYMKIIVTNIIDSKIATGSNIETEPTAKEIESKTLFNYKLVMQIIKEVYTIKKLK